MPAHLIGIGQLSWWPRERRSDRYGAVSLFENASPRVDNTAIRLSVMPIMRARGRLLATVLETRESEHIGDLFRGLAPGGAEVGRTYELGRGTLFATREDDVEAVGVEPDDGRTVDWLDPTILYTLHQQTVRLVFEPDAKA